VEWKSRAARRILSSGVQRSAPSRRDVIVTTQGVDPMKALLLLAVVTALMQPPSRRFEELTFRTPEGGTILYGLSIPGAYDPRQPRPLVLALHPGGDRTPYYGDMFMRQIFLPGLDALDPIMVAPDCPSGAWTDAGAERAVMALLDKVMTDYAIDRRRILVTGFSLGGSGTWFMSSRHPDLFTAAIVMAGRTDEPTERLGAIPTYVIHSREDEVVPFAQAQQRTGELERMGRIVEFDALQGLGHYNMGGYVGALQRAGRWVAQQWTK
jgi:predicted peptidase